MDFIHQIDGDSDSDLDILNVRVEDNRVLRRRKLFTARIKMGISDFKERFRLEPHQVDQLLLTIGPDLQQPTSRSGALSPKQQILITLRFLATGSFYKVIADSLGFSKATVGVCIRRCVAAINTHLFAVHVRWSETNDVARRFYGIGGMPAVAGCIDGTHVKIEAPVNNEEQYVNRHGQHSINAACVCGPDLFFLLR